ncbi:MAG: delta-lactam-biosynthetic de-N-acetylase [Firmicutes bacterium HGW-Firmicutes-1]|jgi:peptidoglycan-N-acetylmuramic acid deacetylase|nr:MAG: delta-lactam-biosynthetic de-N-acetylase [Firmicutes bacterium HGW-Firmicutes-1]
MFKLKKHKIPKIVILLAIVLILELIPLAVRAGISIKYGNDWGLGSTDEGIQPVGNEDVAYLKQYDAYYVGNSNDKVIYLTFDAGYENGYTQKLLDVLKKQEVPATFFLVGHYLKTNPELVKRIVDEGHIIGNHTCSHPDMTKLSPEEFNEELQGFEVLYKEITGENLVKFYRPPAGRYSEANLKTAQELGYKTIFWSVAYVDWDNDKQPTIEDALSKVLPKVHPGAIVLLHSNSKTNSEILDALISSWKDKGYTFKSLDQIE